jgi:hypothetical protein
MAPEVGKTIGIRRVQHSIVNFTECDLVTLTQRLKYNIITYQRHKVGLRKNSKIHLLTEKGLKRLLCNSRSIESAELAKFLGIDIYSYKPPIKEANYIGAIIRSFPGEEFILQYTPDDLNYRVDAYMSVRNIAIECDENHHVARSKQDLARQAEITRALGCTWVRFAPDDPDFDIFAVIGEIYSLVHGMRN